MRPAPLALATVLLAAILAGCAEPAPAADAPATQGPDARSAPVGTEPATPAEAAREPAKVALTITAVGIYPATPAFESSATTIPAGARVALTFQNRDQGFVFDHDVVIDGIEGARTDAVGHGQDAMAAFDAPTTPGKHTFYCSLPGHRDRGMVGELEVVA